MRNLIEKLIVPSLIVITAASMRLLPHPANFAPIGAMALFGGASISNKKLAIILPLVTMFVSDLSLGFHNTMVWVYGSFILITLLGIGLRKQMNIGNLLLASVASSLLFFVITNFGVWFSGTMYDKTFAGLLECYYMGLPFFRNTFLGDLFYNGLIFGSYYLISTKIIGRYQFLKTKI